MQKKEHPIEPVGRIRMVRTYGHILIYTRHDDTVINVSPNFSRFFGPVDVKGKSLAEALTISNEEGSAILEKIRKERKLQDLPIQVRNLSGAIQEIQLNGVTASGPQNAYAGSNILLRMRVSDPSFDRPLGPEARSMIRYLLNRSESNDKTEIGQFLSDYYLCYIKSLRDMAFREGGEAMSQALLDQLLETAKKHDWTIQFNLQTVLDSDGLSLKVLREALPILLETSKQFVSDITDPTAVEAHMREVSSQFSEIIHRDILFYGKAENEVGFSDHRKGNPDGQH
jgi:hypothetical protein